jgi:hypothetical protein
MIKTKLDLGRNPKEKEYPYLGYFTSEQIVLFTSPNTGTLLWSSNDKHKIGYWSDKWSEIVFEVFKGSLNLTNDMSE